MDWTEEVIAQLKALWAEGHSTAEIGRRMGISKNAVVGKAHRLNLPPRPSPIRREEGEARTPAPRRVTGATLPSMAAPVAEVPQPPAAVVPQPVASVAPAPEVARKSAPVAREVSVPAVVETPAAPVARPARSALHSVAMSRAPRRGASCCWPLGEPGTRDFHFCDAEAAPGRPYCAEHVQLAYVKVRDRREDAA